jgi:hypothetical protein
MSDMFPLTQGERPMRRRALIAAGVIAAAGGVALPATSVLAAPSSNASCVATVTSNPDFGPPGLARPYGITGQVVQYVAHSPHDDCYAFLQLLGG